MGGLILGRLQQTALNISREYCSDLSLVAAFRDVFQATSPATLSNWRALKKPMPVGALPVMLRHLDMEPRLLVANAVLRDTGVIAIPEPEGHSGLSGDFDHQLTRLSALLGDLCRTHIEARSPDSESGCDISPAERAARRKQLKRIQTRIAELLCAEDAGDSWRKGQ